jgi:hypothetical protein
MPVISIGKQAGLSMRKTGAKAREPEFSDERKVQSKEFLWERKKAAWLEVTADGSFFRIDEAAGFLSNPSLKKFPQ